MSRIRPQRVAVCGGMKLISTGGAFALCSSWVWLAPSSEFVSTGPIPPGNLYVGGDHRRYDRKWLRKRVSGKQNDRLCILFELFRGWYLQARPEHSEGTEVPGICARNREVLR